MRAVVFAMVPPRTGSYSANSPERIELSDKPIAVSLLRVGKVPRSEALAQGVAGVMYS